MSTHNTRDGIEEWKEDFTRYYGALLNKPVCCEMRNKDCGCDGETYLHEIVGFIDELLHQELQKASQTWLRKEIVKLEGMKKQERQIDYDGTGLYEGGFNSALEYILDRYQSELDQPITSNKTNGL